MKYAEFAGHYRPLATIPYGLPPEQEELEGLAIEVGKQVHAYLLGESDLRAVGHAGVSYALTAQSHWEVLQQAISSEALKDKDRDNVRDKEDIDASINAATHLVHAMYLPYYAMLEQRGKAKPATNAVNIGRTALSLALEGTDLAQERQRLSEARYKTDGLPYKLFSVPYGAYKSLSDGFGTELDLYQILIDMAREHPELVVLGGLPQFERGKKSKATNADMLVLNTLTQHAVGIQAKVRCTAHDRDIYDNDVVQLVSGDEDMDNVRAVRFWPNSSERTKVSWPGYIALHRLATLGNNSVVMNAFAPAHKKMVLRHRARAQAILGDTGPRFRTAKAKIAARLLPHLQDAAAVPPGNGRVVHQ